MGSSLAGAPKPRFEYDYDLATELAALDRHRRLRLVPVASRDTLRLATWNVANFGAPAQVRRDADIDLIAHIIGWFDLVALQEIRGNTAALAELERRLSPTFALVFSDPSGNDERVVFAYRRRTLTLLSEVGEIDVPWRSMKALNLKKLFATGTAGQYADALTHFQGWDRSPYIATFQWGSTSFCIAAAHLYFGANNQASRNRRALEALALAEWAHRYQTSTSYTRDALVVGDMNLPAMAATDPVYRALTRRGLLLPSQGSFIGGTTISGKQYDHVMMAPSSVFTLQDVAADYGVFDFDNALFADLRQNPERTANDVRTYMTYYVSDHRPVWARLSLAV